MQPDQQEMEVMEGEEPEEEFEDVSQVAEEVRDDCMMTYTGSVPSALFLVLTSVLS